MTHFNMTYLKMMMSNDAACLPSVGVGKLDKLVTAGFDNGRQLVEYNGIHPSWSGTPRRREAFRELRETVKGLFDSWLETVQKLEQELERTDEEIQKQQEEVQRKLEL